MVRNVLDPPGSLRSLRVVIAEAHDVYREGLADTLRQSGVEVIRAAPDAEVAIRVVEEAVPDVAILDLQLPGISGLEATGRLRRTAPTTLVFVISLSATDTDIIDAIMAGASGYLEKHWPVEEILGPIRTAAVGKPVIPPRVANALLRRIGNRRARDVGPPAASLSIGELEALELFAEDLGVEAISGVLAIDVDAVHDHAASIFTKLRSHPRRGWRSKKAD